MKNPSILNHMLYSFTLFLTLYELCTLADAFAAPAVKMTCTRLMGFRDQGIRKNYLSSDVSCKMTESNRNGSGNKDVDDLMESASRLRREAELLEEEMSKKRAIPSKATASSSVNKQVAADISYTSINDSKWTVSYRFASDPISTSEDENKEGEEPKKLIFYSGKVTVLFRADGYTDIVESSNDDNNNQSLKIKKFWGWDAEIDQEDGLKYLAYSADVILPKSDPNYSGDSSPTRIYFNNRIDTDEKSKVISLSDGKVTVKRNIEPPGGFWSIFKTEGILAQFRYCGDFICKPTL